MEFRLEFTPKPFVQKLRHQDKLFLMGSCFTEQIGSKLAQHKFSVLDNPNGILFNPVSISQSLTSYMEQKHYGETDLFYENELWGSWQHHTRFSALKQDDALAMINASQEKAHDFLKEADWLLLTLGSAFIYEKEGQGVVANCHKVPTDKFNKKLMTVDEVIRAFDTVIYRLKIFNPALKIIFTISPVRHLRDGFVENNRSKATLITAVHHLVDKFDGLFYFPAYELVIDDLRDYRFFAEDMVHPNYAATNYVWEKFQTACIDDAARGLMKEIALINNARNHKAFNPQSAAHQKFLAANLRKIEQLRAQYPHLNLAEEAAYFAAGQSL
ncbi:MAG: hypothetical protein JWQ27_114 [Ferruginibacter sp.]|nr:hypothetical protein [Ferruginibacter sp.]